METHQIVAELFKSVIENKEMNLFQKKMLLSEIRKLKAPDEDRWVYRAVVIILGAVALGTVSYSFWGHEIPPNGEIPSGLLAIGSAAMGALAGYLTPSIKPRGEPPPPIMLPPTPPGEPPLLPPPV